MKTLTTGVCLLTVLAATTVWANSPGGSHAARTSRTETRIATGELQPTAEMWFYEQYQQQYDDPSVGVRSKAEFRASQRQSRMAAMQWFGQSNSRPRASSDPFHGDYSPRWTSNHGHYPNRWMGRGAALIVVRSDESRTR